MKLGFEIIGNATIIVYDEGRPLLVTDPWISDDAYFGSWTHSFEIPEAQMTAIKHTEYVWISHGHPDHLDHRSIEQLKDKKFVLPTHFGNRIYNDLKELGYQVSLLKDRTWTSLSPKVRILSTSDYNQDAIILIDMDGTLLINTNDADDRGWGVFLRKTAGTYKNVFLTGISGFGDPDMMNYYDELGNFLQPQAAEKNPVGPFVAHKCHHYKAKYFIPSSSMHRYQRTDSAWGNQYITELSDHYVDFQSKTSEMLPAFVRYDVEKDTITPINPPEKPLKLLPPETFGDNWLDNLTLSEEVLAKQYFQKIAHFFTFLDFIDLKVGGKITHIPIAGKGKYNRGITFEVPRNSLMTCIQYEIFDDLLIGNFMKVTLHGKWTNSRLYPDFNPYLCKYADNGRAKSEEELKQYFEFYRKRAYLEFVVHRMEMHSKNVIRSYIPFQSDLYKRLKKIYYDFW